MSIYSTMQSLSRAEKFMKEAKRSEIVGNKREAIDLLTRARSEVWSSRYELSKMLDNVDSLIADLEIEEKTPDA